MAISNEATIRSCFEIARVIYADSLKIHNGYGVVLELSDLDTLKDALRTYLTSTLDSDSTTKVEALVVAWDAVRLNVGRIEGGAIGELSSLTYTADEKRQQIKELFQTYVPVMHIVDSIKRRENAAPNTSTGFIPIRRG